jgi:hypothetical protein
LCRSFPLHPLFAAVADASGVMFGYSRIFFSDFTREPLQYSIGSYF